MNRNLEKAIRVAKKGGIIIFPTDTAFGIGCKIDSPASIERLFKIRNRSSQKAVPVLASSIKMVEEYALQIDPATRRLMKKYWPGGVTIILKCKKEKIPLLARGGGDTIGIRIPGNRTALLLIRKVGVPILAPSANFSGGKTPFRASDINIKLARLVDFFLAGRCKMKEASTVIDVTKKPWKVLRQGAVRLGNSD